MRGAGFLCHTFLRGTAETEQLEDYAPKSKKKTLSHVNSAKRITWVEIIFGLKA